MIDSKGWEFWPDTLPRLEAITTDARADLTFKVWEAEPMVGLASFEL